MASKTILLVEDNPDDEWLILRTLRRNRVANRVSVARNGAEALNFLFCRGPYIDRDPSDLPEVIILDLGLPEVDGLGVLRIIRVDKRTSQLPVIILTSSKDDEDLIDSYRFGANSFLRKPVEFRQLMQVIRQLGMTYLLLNEAPSH